MSSSILIIVTAWIIDLITRLGYLGIFLGMTIESASIPLPSEIIMGISGYQVYLGHMNIFLVGLIGALGNLCGSTIMYYLGEKGGRPIIQRYGKILHISEERFNKVSQWFVLYGDKIIFFSQIIPIIRTFISLPAGILNIDFKKFAIYTFSGAFIWCSLIAFISYLLGPQWQTISDYIKKFENIILLIILFLIIAYIAKWFINKRKININR